MLPFLLSISDESDHGRVRKIYSEYKREMLHLARKRLENAGRKNPAFDAEDAVQAALFKIIKYIDNIDFSRDKAEIKNYVFSILSNEINKIIGHKEIDTLDVDEYPDMSSEKFVEQLGIEENYSRVVKFISQMDEIYSTTLTLVFVNEMSVKDVARVMGVSAKTVYTRLERGRQILISNLKGELYD